MSILALTSDTLIGTAAAGNIEYNGQFFGTDSNASRAQLQRIVLSTAVASTSGTSIDFTGIPAWVEKITVMFSGVSTNGSSNLLVQLGDSGGVETTGYTSVVGNNAATATSTAGLIATSNGAAGSVLSGIMTIISISTNAWVSGVTLGDTTNTQTPYAGGGSKSTSATLDRVRITTVNGTDTFDAGSINIMYEG
jgi:hypothetical protein